MSAPYQINQVLSTGLLRSAIFDDLIQRLAAAAPEHALVTKSVRPRPGADVFHYHRPNLERRLKGPAVVSVHHDLREQQPWLDIGHFLPRYREAALVHCLNQTQRAILEEHGIRHTRVIPHGIDRRVLPMPARPRVLSGKRLRLGLFSRRYSHGVKGEALFEELLKRLDPARISFLLMGEGRWRDAALARSKGYLAEAFERPPYNLMAEFIGSIDALLILSQYEGGPASLPEALGSGVPILCTPVGMCPDFIHDEKNGLILSGDAASDSDRIISLLDGDAFDRMARNAFDTASTVPDWSRTMGSWWSAYRELAT